MRTRAEQVAAIRADQKLWRELAAEVGAERYEEPGPMGDWSFADMAGHLLGWRNRTIGRLDAAARREPEPPPPWPRELDDDDSFVATDGPDPDAINAWIREQHAGRAPEQLVRDYEASYDRLVTAIESLPDDLLTDPDAFPWIGAPLVTVDFTGHLHEEHLAVVRAWLDG
jgi:hypothetical protein